MNAFIKVTGIVHIIGGITEYVGEVGEVEVEVLGYWVELKKPCSMMTIQKGNQIQSTMSLLGGPEYVYHHKVWLYLPKDSLIEIRELDPEGGLYQLYERQINTPKYEGNIALPGTPGFEDVRAKVKDKNKFRPLKH